MILAIASSLVSVVVSVFMSMLRSLGHRQLYVVSGHVGRCQGEGPGKECHRLQAVALRHLHQVPLARLALAALEARDLVLVQASTIGELRLRKPCGHAVEAQRQRDRAPHGVLRCCASSQPNMRSLSLSELERRS
jgi:hypothetical protein